MLECSFPRIVAATIMLVLGAIASCASAYAEGAVIGIYGSCEVDTFVPGAELYTNRDYVVAECPEALRGLPLLRSSIDWVEFECLESGEIIILTPDPVHEIAKK